MNIDEAARATRAFYIEWNGLKDAKVWQVFTSEHVAASRGFNSRDDAQAACDLMNLRAVLEAIREPTENVARACRETADVESGYYEHNPYDRWRAMIDALLEEVGE